MFFVLTGCWSSKEIENLGIAVGIALDSGQKSKLEKGFTEKKADYSKENLMTITYQVINTEMAGGGPSNGTPQAKQYNNISETGDSVLQITREISLREKPIFGQHFKVIILGDKISKTRSIYEILDTYIRDNEFRPSLLVFITSGNASDVLELNEVTEIPTFKITELAKNSYRVSRILPKLTLKDLVSKMESKSSFAIQNIVSVDGELKFSGAGIIKGKTRKLTGYLSEEETEGLNWITGDIKGGVVKHIDKKNKKEKVVTLDISKVRSKIVPKIKGNIISFELTIDGEGGIGEQRNQQQNLDKNKSLKRVEKIFEKQTEKIVRNTIDTLQKDYQADAAGFGKELSFKYPKQWKKLKDNWDQTFSEIPIHTTVNITIKHFGLSEE